MPRFAAGIEYDGRKYKGGIQRPKTVRTSCNALSRVADAPVECACAGRTDAGVHASAQVVISIPTPSAASVAGASEPTPIYPTT
jgi:tRNA pseudouridine38-40 synthase